MRYMSPSTKQFYDWVMADGSLKGMAFRIVSKSPGRRLLSNLTDWIEALEYSGDRTAIDIEALARVWIRECSAELTDVGRAHLLLRRAYEALECSPEEKANGEVSTLLDDIREFLKL